jgi:uncharacterized protein (TIGR02265 family)
VVTRDRNFVEPPWSAPLDVAAALRAIPETATVAGLFLEPIVNATRKAGMPIPSARDRYVPFRFYPMREHAQLLIEACGRLYPELSLRLALRKLGRAAPVALVASTLGKVVLGSASGASEVMSALVKAYPINVRPCELQIKELSKGRAIVSIQQLHFFLDCHHVGAFEGALRYAGLRGDVAICSYSNSDADLRCTWSEP